MPTEGPRNAGLQRPVLSCAAQPLPTELGTLDAIQLATALLWQETTDRRVTMATHDGALAGLSLSRVELHRAPDLSIWTTHGSWKQRRGRLLARRRTGDDPGRTQA